MKSEQRIRAEEEATWMEEHAVNRIRMYVNHLRQSVVGRPALDYSRTPVGEPYIAP